MTYSSDAEPRFQGSLSAVSISDYEVLIAPRGAFVDFLLGRHAVVERASGAGPSPWQSER